MAISDTLQQGYIKPSLNLPTSAVFRRRKGVVICILDYHGLNGITVKYSYQPALVPSDLREPYDLSFQQIPVSIYIVKSSSMTCFLKYIQSKIKNLVLNISDQSVAECSKAGKILTVQGKASKRSLCHIWQDNRWWRSTSSQHASYRQLIINSPGKIWLLVQKVQRGTPSHSFDIIVSPNWTNTIPITFCGITTELTVSQPDSTWSPG